MSAISRVADTEGDDMHGGKQVELGEMPDRSASTFGEGPYLQVVRRTACLSTRIGVSWSMHQARRYILRTVSSHGNPNT
jgi:hypothetical protein